MTVIYRLRQAQRRRAGRSGAAVVRERIVSAVATLAARVEQYLAERRRLGFDLRTMSYSLRSLAEHVRKTRHRDALTIEVMAAWARQTQHGAGTPATWERRLRRLRPFTRWSSSARRLPRPTRSSS